VTKLAKFRGVSNYLQKYLDVLALILSVTSHAIEGGKSVLSGPLLKAIYRHRIQLLVTDSMRLNSPGDWFEEPLCYNVSG